MNVNNIAKDKPNESLDNKGDARRKKSKDSEANQSHNDWPSGMPARNALCKQTRDSERDGSKPKKECTTVIAYVGANRVAGEIDCVVPSGDSNHDPNDTKEDRPDCRQANNDFEDHAAPSCNREETKQAGEKSKRLEALNGGVSPTLNRRCNHLISSTSEERMYVFPRT